jgi:hypothetical protein
MAPPPWLTTLVSLLVAVAAIAVLVADDADVTWSLSNGTAAILGGLAGGLAGWQAPSPHDPKENAALKARIAELEAWQSQSRVIEVARQHAADGNMSPEAALRVAQSIEDAKRKLGQGV